MNKSKKWFISAYKLEKIADEVTVTCPLVTVTSMPKFIVAQYNLKQVGNSYI